MKLEGIQNPLLQGKYPVDPKKSRIRPDVVTENGDSTEERTRHQTRRRRATQPDVEPDLEATDEDGSDSVHREERHLDILA